MSNFSFSFSGDDIDIDDSQDAREAAKSSLTSAQAAETGTLSPRSSSSTPAFPIPGLSLLPPKFHSIDSLLAALPSRISYSTLKIKLDDGSELNIPRRELWDVRVQLMAEGDDEGLGAVTGKDDVKTGVYEGGFKSWESAVDLVRVLHARESVHNSRAARKIIELGCGTALPSLAIFQWFCSQADGNVTLDLGLADYNPSVLALVTLPNIILSWAQQNSSPTTWEEEGELELESSTIQSFVETLSSRHITLSFFSGAWGPDFDVLVMKQMFRPGAHLTIVGAETIYSPAALHAFAQTIIRLLSDLQDKENTALVAAKLVYFGVGGSMEDFCQLVRENGCSVRKIREESEGVVRATVEVRKE